MSGMDRLTDEELEYLAKLHGERSDVHSMARELLAHRRASQAAPDDQFVTTLPQEAFEAFAKACEDAPTPSDGLLDALCENIYPFIDPADAWSVRSNFEEILTRADLTPAPAKEGQKK